jgi:hypothetical protein
MPSSLSETVRAEASRAHFKEKVVPGALASEKMVEAPAQTRAIGADTSLCASDSHMNGAEPWSAGAPARTALPLEPSGETDLSPSQEAVFDDVSSVPGSFDIVDLGIGKLGLLRYPQVPPLPADWGKW